MTTLFYILLFIFWSLFGSFASVIIYRLKSGEWGIWTGRSHCKTCERNLSAIELIPIFSWLTQWWKCKWCKEKISPIYPLLELTMWVLFLAVGYFLISPELVFWGNFIELMKLNFFLGVIFFTVIYAFYDILYLEIPESVLAGANILTLSALILTNTWIPIIPTYTMWAHDFLLGHAIIAGILIAWLYTIMLAWLKEIYDFCILLSVWIVFFIYVQYLWSSNDLWTWGTIYHNPLLSGSLAAFWIFISFFLQVVLSGWRWMGAGDLRIAILMGLFVWVSFAFPAWMITYLIWSIIGVWVICWSKIKNGFKTDFEHQIPFGPFLACWYLSILFFHPHISKLIESYF